MTDKLDRVREALARDAAAYQKAKDEEDAALEALAAAKKRREAAGKAVEQRRAALHKTILRADQAEIRQVDIVKLSGYTRDRVYNIIRNAKKAAEQEGRG